MGPAEGDPEEFVSPILLWSNLAGFIFFSYLFQNLKTILYDKFN